MIISTIHRSKGLEFDSVLILQPHGYGQSPKEETRVLYVAATRARKRLGMLERERKIFMKSSPVGHTSYQKIGRKIFLHGEDDLDWDVLDPALQRTLDIQDLQNELVRILENPSETENEIYIYGKKNGNSINFALAIRRPAGAFEDICWCGRELNRALYGSLKRMPDLGNGIKGFPLALKGLRTVAFEVTDEDATDKLGGGGRTLLPVLGPTLALPET
jgi:hypothetical protein